MPLADLESLSKNFLLTNLKFAYQARADVPWGAELPEELFLNDVLPYASINERRDDLAKGFLRPLHARRQEVQDAGRGGPPPEQRGLPAVRCPL